MPIGKWPKASEYTRSVEIDSSTFLRHQILAIDPGNVESAWMLYDTNLQLPIEFAKEANEELIYRVRRDYAMSIAADHLAIEMIASYGMAVGETVFETCLWIGRFIEAWGGDYTKVKRIQVKSHICHSARATDSNIRQALIDRYGEQGTKKQPGPTYGISKDIWSALAVATYWADNNRR